jgi:hypothetical protein
MTSAKCSTQNNQQNGGNYHKKGLKYKMGNQKAYIVVY